MLFFHYKFLIWSTNFFHLKYYLDNNAIIEELKYVWNVLYSIFLDV